MRSGAGCAGPDPGGLSAGAPDSDRLQRRGANSSPSIKVTHSRWPGPELTHTEVYHGEPVADDRATFANARFRVGAASGAIQA
ncbi:MAG: hypothetical protein NVS2B9_00120 [Myxococcales bacterium]